MIRKALITLSLSLLLSGYNFAQTDDTVRHTYPNQIDVLYGWSHTGHQLLINYNQHWGRHALVAGLKYFFDSNVNQPYSRLTDWRFRKPDGDGVLSRIGLSLGYEFHLFKNPPPFDPYVFGQVQHENYILATNPDIPLASEGPFTIIEAVAGIGVEREFYPQVSLNASVGIGSAFFIDDGISAGTPPFGTFDGDFSERAIILRVGLSYSLR